MSSRTCLPLCLAFAIVAFNSGRAADRPSQPPAGPGTVPGAAPVVKIARPAFRLVVQKDAKLPAGDRPEATVPSGDGRLSLTIQSERKQFPANGPISLTVTLKNVSEKPFSLYDVDRLGTSPALVLSHVKTGAQVRVEPVDVPAAKPETRPTTVLLEPGKSIARTIVVDAQPQFFAPPPGIPIPLPRPVPRPDPATNRDAPEKPAAQAEELPPPDGRIIGPLPRPIPGPSLLPEGTVRMRLSLEFVAPPGPRAEGAVHWTGKIASEPAEVELTAAVPRPPVIVPPVVPPTNRDQAIPIAHRAAEAALKSAYVPLDPVRPPHLGNWIAEPAKTATTKDRPGGGWTVSWTHTPKGPGHNYHVVVDVTTTGAATVREVFGGYSPR